MMHVFVYQAKEGPEASGCYWSLLTDVLYTGNTTSHTVKASVVLCFGGWSTLLILLVERIERIDLLTAHSGTDPALSALRNKEAKQ